MAAATSPPMSKITISAIGDSHIDSPWTKKLILALDGGGVKGYSSLLILKRLLGIIEELELGIRPLHDDTRLSPCHSSASYPWNSKEPSDVTIVDKEDRIGDRDGDLPAAINQCWGAKHGNEQYKLHHYFDYMAGTSAGGMTAIMLGRLEMGIDTAISDYKSVCNQVFGKPRLLHSTIKFTNLFRAKFPSRRMEKALKEVIMMTMPTLGEESNRTNWVARAAQLQFQSDPATCRTMVVTIQQSQQNKTRPYLFRTYDHHYPPKHATATDSQRHMNPGRAHRSPIWRVARATSAAPTYFSPINIDEENYSDGGMSANNPAQVALREVQQMHGGTPPGLLVSIGTGRSTNPKIVQPSLLPVIQRWHDMRQLTVDLLTQTDGTHTDVNYESQQVHTGFPYVRLDVDVGEAGLMPLDRWVPRRDGKKTQGQIEDMARVYLSRPEVHAQLVATAEALVTTRRLRAETERWETFACKYMYYCPDKACPVINYQAFTERDKLRRHAYLAHGFVVQIPANDEDGALQYPYTCIVNTCRHEGISLFPDEHKFKTHVQKVHKIQNPQFKTRRQMEAWLDDGRELRESRHAL